VVVPYLASGNDGAIKRGECEDCALRSPIISRHEAHTTDVVIHKQPSNVHYDGRSQVLGKMYFFASAP
jgi:hypothetical protein